MLGGCVTRVQETTETYEHWYLRIDTDKAKLIRVHAIKAHLEVEV
jgi:hypothetical protein